MQFNIITQKHIWFLEELSKAFSENFTEGARNGIFKKFPAKSSLQVIGYLDFIRYKLSCLLEVYPQFIDKKALNYGKR